MLHCYCVFKLLKIKAVRLGEKVIVQESGIGSKGSKVMESKVMGGGAWGQRSRLRYGRSHSPRSRGLRIRGSEVGFLVRVQWSVVNSPWLRVSGVIGHN